MVPGVSRRSNVPQRSQRTSRVTPALSPVLARFCPLKRLTTVLLPVLGIPATIKRKVRLSPLASARARFSSVIAESFCTSVRLEETSEALHLTQARPFSSISFKKPSAPESARSALFKRYKIGFSPKTFLRFLFSVAAGARASSTQITPSQSSRFSSMSRMAFVICPGNHCIVFAISYRHLVTFSTDRGAAFSSAQAPAPCAIDPLSRGRRS